MKAEWTFKEKNKDFITYHFKGEKEGLAAVGFTDGVCSHVVYFTELPNEASDFNWHAFPYPSLESALIEDACSDYTKS